MRFQFVQKYIMSVPVQCKMPDDWSIYSIELESTD